MQQIRELFKQETYTRKELANVLRISYQTRKDTIFHRIKSYKPGKFNLYKREDIIEYLESIN